MRLLLYKVCCIFPEHVRLPWHEPAVVYYLEESDVIDIYGHRFGLSETETRDRLQRKDGLEASLERPKTWAYYEDADFVRQTSVLAHALSEGHNFSDGNKRIAYHSTLIFMEEHGYRLGASEDRFTAWLIMMSAPQDGERRGRWTKEDFEKRLRSHMTLSPRLLVKSSTWQFID